MRRPSWFQLVLMMAMLVVIGVILVMSRPKTEGGQGVLAGQRPTSPAAAPPVHQNAPAAYPVPIGLPAIHLSAALANSSGARFTAADVRQYVTTHHVEYALPGYPAPVVVSVQFLTAAQVSAQLQGESMGVPDSTLLCLVHVNGTFRGDAPYGAVAYTFHDGALVFDAHTGNLLVTSVGSVG